MPECNYLLFIEAEPINANLQDYFSQFNISVVVQQQINFEKLKDKVANNAPLAILINWSRIQQQLLLLKQFYTNYTVPLIVLSETANEEACIKALEAGADDFIIKPIHPRELHARISAISRRVTRAKHQEEHEKEVLTFANWRLYPASRRVFNEQQEELFLSAGEYELLMTFIQQPQKILDRELLLQITKNSDLNPFDRRIDVQISRLRQKIEVDAKKPMLIKTIRNGGYVFTAKVITSKESDCNK